MPDYNPKEIVTVRYNGKRYAGVILSYSLGNYDVQITLNGRNTVVTVPASDIE